LNANCQVVNHLPSCTCISGYTGDPFRQCNFKQNERKINPPQIHCPFHSIVLTQHTRHDSHNSTHYSFEHKLIIHSSIQRSLPPT
jgi:hypothetical protein